MAISWNLRVWRGGAESQRRAGGLQDQLLPGEEARRRGGAHGQGHFVVWSRGFPGGGSVTAAPACALPGVVCSLSGV